MGELVQIFYEPGKVFDKIREKRIWVAAFLASLIFAIGVSAYVLNAIGLENIVRKQLDSSSFTQRLPQEQKDKAIQDAQKPAAMYRQVGIIAVAVVIVTCLMSLVAMAIAAIFGGKIKFTQGLGLVSYAGWPFTVIRTVMSVIIISITADKDTLDAQNVVNMSPGAFLDKATTAKPLYALASSLDVLTLAYVVFGAYGLSKVAQIPFAKALTGVAGLWVILTLIRVGFSFIF